MTSDAQRGELVGGEAREAVRVGEVVFGLA